MVKKPGSQKLNIKEVAEMRRRLEELEQTLDAIQSGEVDALVVSGEAGDQVYTLKSAERPYRVMIEEMSEGALTLSAEGIILYSNKSFAVMVKQPLEEIVATPIINYIDSSSRDQFQRLVKYGGKVEISLLAKDQSRVRAYAALNTVHEGEIVNYSLVLTDLTEHLHTEQIIASERFARILLEQAADAVLVCDTSGIIIRASEKAFILLGENLLGQSLDIVFNRLDAISITGKTHQVKTVPVKFSDIRDATFPSGSEVVEAIDHQPSRNLIVAYSEITEGSSILGYSVSLSDITKRKQAEEALRESEQRWATTLKSIGDAVIATDVAGRVTFMNAVSENLTGWVLREAYSKPVTEVFDIINEKTRQRVGNPVTRVIEQGAVAGLANHTVLVRRDGTEVPIDDSAAPIRDQDGNIVGVVLIFRDISGRKRAEGDLLRYREHLEELVEERTNELREATQRVYEVQEKERRQLASELHDQTGQYLTALRLLMGRARKTCSDEAASILDEANGMLGELVAQVRSMSLNLRPAMLDDMGLLHTLIWHFENYQKQTGIEVNFKHNGIDKRILPEINTTAYRILQEALTNAAKYAGVKRVDVRIVANGQMEITVQDEGKGFDINEAKARASNGLSGMRERAFLVGGKVTIESSPGAGTTVKVTLPLTPPPPVKTRHSLDDAKE